MSIERYRNMKTYKIFYLKILLVTVLLVVSVGCRNGSGSGSQSSSNLEEQLNRQSQLPKLSEDMIYPCPDHIFPFCTDENPFGVTYKSGTKGLAAFPQDTNIGCLGYAPAPTWFYMQIANPGDLLIYIEQNGFFSQQLDVDFACWGPFEAASKKEFLDKLCASYYHLNVDQHPNHRPENGNHDETGGYPFGNLVDCSFHPAGTEWCYIPDAKTGEWYLLLLTNYSRQPGTIHFERVAEASTATTNCSVVAPLSIHPTPSGLLKIDDHTSAICLYENKALVNIELEPEEGYTLSKSSLRRCEVTVSANNTTYQAALKEDHFECEIDILNDTTEYFAIITCTDPEFEINTETYRIVRTEDCDPDKVPLIEGDSFHAGDLTSLELIKGNKPLHVDFSDPDGVLNNLPNHPESLNLEDYDVSIDCDEMFIRRVDVSKDGNTLAFTPQIRGDWCQCFVPDTLTLKLRMTPREGVAHGKPYEMPLRVGITKGGVWVGRCLSVIIIMTCLLLLVFYFWGLLKKDRFHKGARLKNLYVVEDTPKEVEKSGKPLRKPGFGPWLNRWLNPFGPEKVSISFSRPKTGAITFIASPSKNRILMPVSSFDPKTMTVPNYTPQPANGRKKAGQPISISAGTSIEIKKTIGSETTRLGHLKYVVAGQNDEGGFRLLIGIFIGVCLIAIVIMGVLMIRALA